MRLSNDVLNVSQLSRRMLLLVALVLTGCTSHAKRPAVAPIPMPHQFVTSSANATPATSPTPLPGVYLTHPQDTSCSSGTLRLTVEEGISEATQQHTRDLRLTNAGTKSCHLFGYPGITLLTAAHRVLPFRVSHKGDQMIASRPPRVIDLAPGHSAWARINTTISCANSTDPTSSQATAWVRLGLPGGSSELTARTGLYPIIEYCGPHDPGSVLDVSAFVARDADLSL